MKWLKTSAVLPGFKSSLTITLLWVGGMVILPFVMLLLTTLQLEWHQFWQTVTNQRVLASIGLSLKLALFATMLNVVFGTIVAWVLVRYQFRGKALLNALIDLPFALPTAVAGIVLASLYAPNGLFGQLFAPLGIKIAFTPLGIAIALVFVSFPFIVRAVQPLLSELDSSLEEAATTLGADRFTIVRRVILPALYPALIGGAGMGLARSLGEYGSVIFIAGNLPLVSEIAPLIIMSKLDIYDMQGAAAVAFLMLLLAFLLLLAVNLWQWYLNRHTLSK
ncbi:sulfate ABC transporter permease subunit CysT [Testudinibacter sp. TR-2022]|uniref:sulfate ABC transporter permease subunit CysT n=1 Tax=Testudinibacter sp. TR-2022 TaxID=2585029 RepID=UPI0011197200|nr:sulfate ABC transporter permease subunit CysT [Testudinibacter sp. TR-2022]TNH05010.1 sulfate ABC transporter permease subunit CysT [Pasteurellaceae bacterium Phil11]TNH21328.1 sulfate ABC transporter permease subunit CysT [Testudinibacter sp. TR-2022]TNH26482.1 sulfate ABC transporter permease subunit CysT [Testudinibacter sp. TR-2022]